MAPRGALLWQSLRICQLYGANTNVGKTVAATILSKAAHRAQNTKHVAFLKPVSTGNLEDADDRHIARHAAEVDRNTLLQYDQPVSPHIAAQGRSIPSNSQLLSQIHEYAAERAARGPGWLFVETAGGVHSPTPSGITQADFYSALRCPTVLVGDSKLGGISLTISAFEALRLRGYDVESILMFQDDTYRNFDYVGKYFQERHDVPTFVLSEPPPLSATPELDDSNMSQYYESASQSTTAREVLEHLDNKHQSRIARLESMAAEASKRIWYPFTQHRLQPASKITAIDSARGDFFQTLIPKSQTPLDKEQQGPKLQPSFDGSASWWTQGLGHGDSSLTLAAAYAAGRYGHVMFAGAVHEPALALAETLLEKLKNHRLTRVFFSDDGSTGVEVAVKMALRAARMRYGWDTGSKIGMIGLKGGYHGDTMGAMDCAEPSTFNEKVEWYEGKGVWLDSPSVKCIRGKWAVESPQTIGDRTLREFDSLSDVFDLDARESRGEQKLYEKYIKDTLKEHVAHSRKFGALILEPVVMGAGGMLLVDPIFQRALVRVVRQSPSLFGAFVAESESLKGNDQHDWSGLPVIFDEVFTGLYRLGRFTASSFLDLDADISVHAKLLTGGLVPLCTTIASESVFKAFDSDDKADALLHGHSYTAHPIGCQVALQSVQTLSNMEKRGEWDWAKSQGWCDISPPGNTAATSALSKSAGQQISKQSLWSVWPKDFVDWLSHQTKRISGTWALGSVLAIHMKAADGMGYKSTAALELQEALLGGKGDVKSEDAWKRWNVHSRVLGNVLYIMGSQITKQEDAQAIEELIRSALSD